MAAISPRAGYRPSPVLAVSALVLAGALVYRYRPLGNSADSAANFKLIYGTPIGWKAEPHSPQALFLFRDPRTNLLIRGAMSDIVSEINPTPDLDRDGTAQWMLDVTSQNLHGWSGKMLDTVPADGGSFRLIRRATIDKTVISAVAVRGNTTIVVTLSADKPELTKIDKKLPAFRTYLAGLAFQRYVYPD